MTTLVDRLAAVPASGHPAARSDPADFDEFVRATGGRIHYAALMLCGDHHLAQDLTQTTYVKVFAHWSRVSRMDSPLAYTHTVLVRTFLSHRRLRRSSERPVDQLPEGAIHGPDTGARLDVVAALRQLSPRDRAVLVLRYWEDLSVSATAEVLGIGTDACRGRTARAIARLRPLLTPDHDVAPTPGEMVGA